MHQGHVKELHNLILKKMQVEKDIIQATLELQEAYQTSKDIFGVVLSGRIEDCEENLKQLCAVTDKDWEQVEESQEL